MNPYDPLVNDRLTATKDKPVKGVKYGHRLFISDHELTSRPGLPSQVLREREAHLIGELARSVALSGHRFDGWPTITLSPEQDRFGFHLYAEVITR